MAIQRKEMQAAATTNGQRRAVQYRTGEAGTARHHPPTETP